MAADHRVCGGVGAPERQIRHCGELAIFVPMLGVRPRDTMGNSVRRAAVRWPRRAPRDGFAEQIEQLIRGAVPAMVRGDLASGGPHPPSEFRIAQHAGDALGDLVGMRRDEARATLIEHLAIAAALGGDHRARRRRRLERHHSKGLALRRVDAN